MRRSPPSGLRAQGGLASQPDPAHTDDIALFARVDDKMRRLLDVARKMAASPIPVLLLGETGVGKTLLARYIHDKSPRAAGPFQSVNCPSIPEPLFESELFGHERGSYTGAVSPKKGLLEIADKGTMFLDEIGELSLSVQPKLLDVIPNPNIKRVGGTTQRLLDVRFIAATNRDLKTDVIQGRFRKDLFERLNGYSIQIPPLRERGPEIDGLARAFMERYCAETGRVRPRISEGAAACLREHRWPGNIRELRNVMMRAVTLCDGDEIDERHILFDDAPPARNDINPLSDPEPTDSATSYRFSPELIARALREVAELPPSHDIEKDQAKIRDIFKKHQCQFRNFSLLCGELVQHQKINADLLKNIPKHYRALFASQRKTLREPRSRSSDAIVEPVSQRSRELPSSIPPGALSVPSLPVTTYFVGMPSSIPPAGSRRQGTPNDVTASLLRRICHNRYLERLYVKRSIEDAFDDFHRSGKKLFVIADVAGSGKTAVSVKIAERLIAEGRTVLLVRGADIPANVATWSVDGGYHGGLLEWALSAQYRIEMPVELTPEMVRETPKWRFWSSLIEHWGGAPITLFIDAINECQAPRSTLHKGLAESLQCLCDLDVKVLLTCRFEAWNNGEHGAAAIITPGVREHVYSSPSVHPKYGSARLGSSEDGLFSEEEFKQAWEQYTGVYHIVGQPTPSAAILLRHPLFLWFFCEANRGRRLGRFADVTSSEVLRSYAANVRIATVQALLHSPDTTSLRGATAIEHLVDECIGRVAWLAVEQRCTWMEDTSVRQQMLALVRQHEAASMLDRSADEIVDALVSKLCLDGVLRRRLHANTTESEYKFVFEVFQEYCCGRWLARSAPFVNGCLDRELVRLADLARSGSIQAPEILRHVVLERELRSHDYIDLLRWLAAGDYELQNAACEAIQNLLVVQGVRTEGRSDAIDRGFREIRASARMRRLLGLAPPDSARDDERSSIAVRNARTIELGRIFEQVLDRIPERRDFTVRFALRCTLETMVERQPDAMWPHVETWCRFDQSFLKRTVGIAILPAFGAHHAAAVERLLDLFHTPREPGFWIRRSVGEAMAEIVRRWSIKSLREAGALPDDPTVNDVCERFEAALMEAAALTSDDIERAMLYEKYIYLRAARLLGPDGLTGNALRDGGLSWPLIASLRAVGGVTYDWVVFAKEHDEIAPMSTGADDSGVPVDPSNLQREVDAFYSRLEAWNAACCVAERLEEGLSSEASWPRRVAARDLQRLLIERRSTGYGSADDRNALPDEPEHGRERARAAVIFAGEYFDGSLHDHPECKERIFAVLDRLDGCRGRNARLFDYKRAVLAKFEDLIGGFGGRKVHDESYVSMVEATSKLMKHGRTAWRVFRDMEVRPGSWTAACRSAGALIRGVDLVWSKEYRVALCPSRPPGHLAGNRICIFDNISIAIRWLQKRDAVRVFVFDADAHHGLHVQQSFYDDPGVFYCSMHEADVHPGQGFASQVGAMTADATDKEEIAYDGLGTTLNIPLGRGTGPEAYLALFRGHVLPAVERFSPDLIIIAGGVDGDARDPFSNLGLTPECFHVVAQELQRRAPRGIVISLEGGYDLRGGLPDGVEALLLGALDEPLPERLRRRASESEVKSARSGAAEAVQIIEVIRSYERPLALQDVFVCGSVVKVLECDVSAGDLSQIPASARYGIGAGSLDLDRTAALSDLGELIVAAGVHATARPAAQLTVETGVHSLSPFFVGWNNEPEVMLRFHLSRATEMHALLAVLAKAFDCPAPVLGVVGYVDVPCHELREKRLILSPAQAHRGGRDRHDADRVPLCLSKGAFHEFFASTHPNKGATLAVVGFVVRVGHSSWRSRREEARFAAMATYGRRGTAQEGDVLVHIHMAQPVGTVHDAWDLSDVGHLKSMLKRDFYERPVFVSHLESSTLVGRAVLGVVPLRVSVGKW